MPKAEKEPENQAKNQALPAAASGMVKTSRFFSMQGLRPARFPSGKPDCIIALGANAFPSGKELRQSRAFDIDLTSGCIV